MTHLRGNFKNICPPPYIDLLFVDHAFILSHSTSSFFFSPTATPSAPGGGAGSSTATGASALVADTAALDLTDSEHVEPSR